MVMACFSNAWKGESSKMEFTHFSGLFYIGPGPIRKHCNKTNKNGK